MIMVFIHLCFVFGNGIAFSENGIFLLCIFNLILFDVSLSPCWYKGKRPQRGREETMNFLTAMSNSAVGHHLKFSALNHEQFSGTGKATSPSVSKGKSNLYPQ